MNKSTLAVLTILGLVALPAMAETKTELRKVIQRGVQNGVPGTWLKEYQDTYHWQTDPVVLQIMEVYQQELGGTWTPSEVEHLKLKLDNGTLTLDGLRQQLKQAKPLLTDNDDLAKEWHSRELDLSNLRATFGNSGGWIDGLASSTTLEQFKNNTATSFSASFPALIGGDLEKARAYAEGNGGDGISLIGQSSRLLKLAQLIESGLLPSGKFSIEGVFTHYTESWFTIASSPYFAPVTSVFNNSGGSWSDIISLVQGGANADQIQRAIYKWYSERWGQAFKIDMNNVTSAQLREAAAAIYRSAASTGSPIALDLSGNNRIGVTGRSTAQKRKDYNVFVADGAVNFDLFGTGKPIHIEWMNSEHDALLVDDRKGEVTKAAKTDGIISGKHLFGNAGGFDNGYIKLAMILLEQNRVASAGNKMPAVKTALADSGLDGLKAWVDRNHDAKVQPQELYALDALGITSMEVFPQKVKNEHGETLIQSSYTEKGQKKLAEDVWFAIDPKNPR